MVTIVDYGMGNLGSVQNMFKRIGAESKISSDLEEIRQAEKILLPGVGAFDSAIARIDEMGLREVLNQKAFDDKIPILGICLGMQLLTDGSDEGKLKGLGFIKGKAHKMMAKKDKPIPHMGWNEVHVSNPSYITKGLQDLALENEKPRFYFVHSYQVLVENEENSILKTEYEDLFDSAIQNNNIVGCQFHPEKSHKFGMAFLKNFCRS